MTRQLMKMRGMRMTVRTERIISRIWDLMPPDSPKPLQKFLHADNRLLSIKIFCESEQVLSRYSSCHANSLFTRNFWLIYRYALKNLQNSKLQLFFAYICVAFSSESGTCIRYDIYSITKSDRYPHNIQLPTWPG
jgi:hypothetical protein